MKKRIASILLALAVCLTLLPTAAWAAEENETTISSVDELLQFAQDVNAGKYDGKTDAVVSLDADLDLTGVAWTPIGSVFAANGTLLHYFSGKFYGNGHTISNLDFSANYGKTEYPSFGFFSEVYGAEISGLTIQGKLDVSNSDPVFFGTVAGVAADSKISDCASDVSFTDTDKYINGTVAMCGYAINSTIEYCQNKGDFSVMKDTSQFWMGGIAGLAENSTVQYCANTGDMTSWTPSPGGIVGQLIQNSKVINCYSTGKMVPLGNGTTDFGGIAGIVGAGTEIRHCYFAGEVDLSQYTATTPYKRLGGIAGGVSSDTPVFENNYFIETENVTACSKYTDAGTAKTLESMKTKDFYKDITDAGGNYRFNPNGTPLLPAPKYTASFVVTPAELANVVIKVNGQEVANPVDLEAGTYTVEVNADNCEVFNSNITITADTATHTQTIAMTYLPADYTKVDEAIAKANALNKDNYKNFSAVEAAVNAVVRDKNITEQAEVDAMAQAIETAIAGLEKKPTSSGGSSAPSYGVSAPASVSNGTVTTRPKNAYRGDTVTVTAKPDAGYVLDSLTVTDAKGRALTLTDKGNGKYTFTMPGSAVSIAARFVPETVTPEPEPVFFRDVPDDAYYAPAVRWAAQNSVTGGVADGLFGPDQPCTRAQIITFLWRAAGSPAPQGIAGLPGDVDGSAYYAQAVLWALENGIASGTGPDAFSPDAPCTRAQSVTFLFRAVGSPASSAASGFRDVADADYFAPAVTWAQRSSVTSGVGSGQFAPHQPCTRAQIITFLFAVYGQK